MNRTLIFVVVAALCAFSAEAALIKNFQAKLKKCNALVKKLQAENKALKDKLDKYAKDLGKCQADLKACQAKNHQLQADNDKLKKENADLKAHIVILNKKIASLQAALKKCKKYNHKVGAANDDGERRLALLIKANNGAFQARFKKIQAKYSALVKRFAALAKNKHFKDAKKFNAWLKQIKALILVKIWHSKHIIAALKKNLKHAQKLVAGHYAKIEKLLAKVEKAIWAAEKKCKKFAHQKRVGASE